MSCKIIGFSAKKAPRASKQEQLRYLTKDLDLDVHSAKVHMAIASGEVVTDCIAVGAPVQKAGPILGVGAFADFGVTKKAADRIILERASKKLSRIPRNVARKDLRVEFRALDHIENKTCVVIHGTYRGKPRNPVLYLTFANPQLFQTFVQRVERGTIKSGDMIVIKLMQAWNKQSAETAIVSFRKPRPTPK